MKPGQAKDDELPAFEIETHDHRRPDPNRDTLVAAEWRSIGVHIAFGVVGWLCIATLPNVILMPMLSPVFFLMGVLLAMFLAGVAVGIGILFDRALHLRVPPSLKGALIGGVSCGTAGCLLIPDVSGILLMRPNFIDVAMMLSTTVVGQYSGAIGGWRTQWQRRLIHFDGIGWRYVVAAPLNPAVSLRFTIWQLLIATTLLAFVLGVAKPSGFFGSRLALIFSAWIPMQAVTLAIGMLIWPYYTAWRIRVFDSSST